MSEKNGKISRTLKSVVDLDTMHIISWDELLRADERIYNTIRREATQRKQGGNARYVCNQCGYPVYPPLDARKRPYWKHFGGAPVDCPWWTGDPRSPDRVSAGQFQGQQEGPLHHKIKYLLADILEMDDSASDVSVEEYVISDEGRRKPDVAALYNGVRTAFEIQLATTQLPVILAKEAFYSDRGMRLVWVTWDFQQRPLAGVKQSFLDIYFSHDENLFSLDVDVISESKKNRKLTLKVHAHRNGDWQCQSIHLDDVSWNSTGLPYVYAKKEAWHTTFENSWVACRRRDAYDYRKEEALLQELSEKLDLEWLPNDWQHGRAPSLFDTLYSLKAGQPVTSNQDNLSSVANTFLGTKGCEKFVNVFEYFTRYFGRQEVLERASVQKKIRASETEQQLEKGSPISLAIRELFPSVVLEAKKLSSKGSGFRVPTLP